MAMHMTMTACVQGDQTEIWDLSQTPPVLRKISSKETASMKANTAWKHPPATTEYTNQAIADIVGFIKWASTGSTKTVKVEDVEEAK